MPIKRFGQQTSPKAALAIPVRPLGDNDVAVVQIALHETAPGWSVELHGICTDEATLVVLPDGGDDAMGPSFLISRDSYGLRLDQVHWDVLTEVGMFSSLTEVVDALHPRLEFCASQGAPASATLH
jgi:hypothetical protein